MGNQLYTPTSVFSAGQKSFANQMKNLQNIGSARRKLEKEKEDLDFKKKEQNLKLEKMRREGRMSELKLKAFEAQQKEYEKQQNSILDGKEAEIGVVEQQTRDKADQAIAVSRQAYQADPQGITQHIMQNRARRTLKPVFKGGHFGYEVVDSEKEALEREKLRLDVESKRKDTSGKPSRKDIIDLAKDLAGKYASAEDVKDMIPEAEQILQVEGTQGSKRSLLDEAFSVGAKAGRAGASNNDVKFDENTENLIAQNMKHYNKSREEVVNALRSKGYIK